MKIYGYTQAGRQADESVPAEMAEVTLQASPDELRRIAEFLQGCANGIEAHGKSWEHEHLVDRDSFFRSSPQFVVFNPECGK